MQFWPSWPDTAPKAMTDHIEIEFFIAGRNLPVHCGDGIWSAPLPAEIVSSTLTYGDYFSVIRRCLTKSRCQSIRSALAQHAGSSVHAGDVSAIHISLEKHGRFYHPAKISVFNGQTSTAVHFVLNVALTETACSILENEYHYLNRLSNEFRIQYIPIVYAFWDATDSGLPIKMFLGQWFEGYLEFHNAIDEHHVQRLMVWDFDDAHFYLTKQQEQQLYRQATYILTSYYNLFTFEQIFPWHHAAGDFIVKVQQDSLDLKLITVRQYAAMTEDEGRDEIAVIENLVLFFLNLTIRMRLDRFEGTGAVAWSNDDIVKSILAGFFEALNAKKTPASQLVIDQFIDLFAFMEPDDLLTICHGILCSYHPDAPEKEIIRRYLQSHIELIQRYKHLFLT